MVSWDWKYLDVATNELFPREDGGCSCILSTEPVIAHATEALCIKNITASQHNSL